MLLEFLFGGVSNITSGRSAAELDYREQYQWDELSAKTELTDEQARLCPPIIGCYSLTSKEFYAVSVEKLEQVKWDVGAMNRLVLEDKKKEMLKGLVGQHYSPRYQGMRGDLIAGKGQSLVILLHGPPGVRPLFSWPRSCTDILETYYVLKVGKTLTAECVAEAVRKPLIALSIGDLVWNEPRLQERLKAEFKRATDWDAILLLDEADVVLEARSFEDVRRNGIVSSKTQLIVYMWLDNAQRLTASST